MIDEKKLTEDLLCKMPYQFGAQAMNWFRNLIEEQPKIGEWIPCSERLPEESLESVIGWDEYSERCCFVQYWGGRWIFGNDTGSVKIVAWQPLPEPYKPKRRSLRNEQRKI